MAFAGECDLLKRAVFLDRDGVINPLVYNPLTGEYESPHYLEDFSIFPYVAMSLKRLIKLGFLLFLVSNQPSFAKGKTTMENIQSIHAAMEHFFKAQDIYFTHYYYCYHHPAGVIPELTCACDCRKPKNKFLINAETDYGVNLASSWFIGDQDSDIECGLSKNLTTIGIENKNSIKKRSSIIPHFKAANLHEAVDIIEKVCS